MSIVWVVVVVIVLLGLSGLASGLNISLMSLAPADLGRKAKIGNKAARKVLPLRNRTNLSLASILIFNVGVISALSLFLDDALDNISAHALNGVLAGVISTLLVVLFGEILPQALFSRHALSYTAALAPLLKTMVFVTYPVSRSLESLLNRLFGNEMPSHLQSRRELGLLITEHLGAKSSELDNDEIEIMRGALFLSEKRVRNIMTDIKSVYWLQPDTLLTESLLDEIKHKGWSRIPILNKQRTTCYGVLLMKDLVDIDIDGSLRLDELPLYPSQLVGSMTALDTLFRKFINGGTHLIPVEKDDLIVGIVTIEDLLEEIVGHEIIDETDRLKKRS